MAAEINKAKQRQKGCARKKAVYAGAFMQGIKNKTRRLAKRVRENPNDAVAAEAHDWWKKNGYRAVGSKSRRVK